MAFSIRITKVLKQKDYIFLTGKKMLRTKSKFCFQNKPEEMNVIVEQQDLLYFINNNK